MADWSDYGIIVRGRETKVACPRCDADGKRGNRNLSIDHDRGLWHCHRPRCGYSGSLDHGISGGGHARAAVDRRDRSRPTPPPSTAVPIPDRDPTQEERVVQWFADRGISRATIDAADIRWARATMPQYPGRAVPVIVYPYVVGGTIVNAKFRGPDKAFRMQPGAPLVLYGLDWCNGADRIVIVEGEMDALSLREAGIDAVLSVPNGATTSSRAGLAYLDSGEDVLGAAREIVIATDGDEAGQALAEEIARRLGRDRCLRAVYPDGCKDANEVLKRVGVAGVRALVDDAVPYPVEGVFCAADYTADVIRLAREGYGEGWRSGIAPIDDLYRPYPGGLSFWTGIPSHGKSTLLSFLAWQYAQVEDVAFAEFVPETYPPQLHYAQYVTRMYDRPLIDLTNDEIEAAMTYIGEQFWLIDPEEPTVGAILDAAEALVRRRGVRGVIIDPFTEILEPDEVQSTKFVKRALTDLRAFARRHDVHVWVVAHPTKLPTLYDESGRGRLPVPSAYDMADSAQWANKGDFICSVYRREDVTEFHVIKVRFQGVFGRRGTAHLRLDMTTKRYREAMRGISE